MHDGLPDLQKLVPADDLLAAETEGVVAEIDDWLDIGGEDDSDAAAAVDASAVAVAGSQLAAADAGGMNLADRSGVAIGLVVAGVERGSAADSGAACL